MRHANRALFVMVFAAWPAVWAGAAQAQSAGSASGLPVPRFVSLKADKVNMHIGPAKTYEVKWLYQRAGLPVEITAEFENWRRIRDADGTEGWVYHSLLSGRRTGMVIAKNPDELVPVYEKSDVESAVVAKLERGVVGTVKRCSGGLVLHQRPRLRGLDPAGPAVGRLSEREGGWFRLFRNKPHTPDQGPMSDFKSLSADGQRPRFVSRLGCWLFVRPGCSADPRRSAREVAAVSRRSSLPSCRSLRTRRSPAGRARPDESR